MDFFISRMDDLSRKIAFAIHLNPHVSVQELCEKLKEPRSEVHDRIKHHLQLKWKKCRWDPIDENTYVDLRKVMMSSDSDAKANSSRQPDVPVPIEEQVPTFETARIQEDEEDSAFEVFIPGLANGIGDQMLDQAEQLLEEALKATTSDEQSKLLLDALKNLTLAVVYNYSKEFLGKALSARAFVHLMLKNYKSAFIDATEALQLDPNMGKAWHTKGNALLQLGCIDEARSVFGEHGFVECMESIENVVPDSTLPLEFFTNYNPLDADHPSDLGREALTGELNRYLLNNNRFGCDPKHHPYQKGNWKSAPDLRDEFVRLAKEARAKKDYKNTVNYINFATIYDYYYMDNPGLLMMRAESYIRIKKTRWALIDANMARMRCRHYLQKLNNQTILAAQASNTMSLILLFHYLSALAYMEAGYPDKGQEAIATRDLTFENHKVIFSAYNASPSDEYLAIAQLTVKFYRRKKKLPIYDDMYLVYLEDLLESRAGGADRATKIYIQLYGKVLEDVHNVFRDEKGGVLINNSLLTKEQMKLVNNCDDDYHINVNLSIE